MANNSCCNGCTKRRLHCHSECEEYKQFRKNLDERNEAIKKAKGKQKILNDYHADAVWKMRKKQHKRRGGKR
jgi:hypothetical protein